MHKLTLLVASLALCALPSLHAQQESMVIGSGDMLHVQVYDTPEMDQHPRVDDAGNAPILFLGNVSVKGKTPAQAAALIADTMIAKQMMRHPQVTVSIEQYATQEVSVLGEAAHPGKFVITTPRPILDVLSMAGGLNNLADRHILIQRQGSATHQETYFVANNPTDSASEMMVAPGDIIIIPRTSLVYVLGDVARPGGYPLFNNDSPATLLETLAQAGSPNRSAVLSGARLMRKNGAGYQQTTLDIAKVEKGKQPDLPLQANDVIFVPFSYAKNFVITGSSVAASVASAAIYVR
jgi:polysaccharide export outer membrane protein